MKGEGHAERNSQARGLGLACSEETTNSEKNCKMDFLVGPRPVRDALGDTGALPGLRYSE